MENISTVMPLLANILSEAINRDGGLNEDDEDIGFIENCCFAIGNIINTPLYQQNAELNAISAQVDMQYI
jgi:hypothetical protein